MKKLIATFALLCATKFVFGDADPELKKFFEVPNSLGVFGIYPNLKPEEIHNESLENTLAQDDGYYEKKGFISGYQIDLNRDGEKEYLVITSMGGSAGRHYFIYQRKKEEWTIIGEILGWFHTIAPDEKWIELIVFSRGGGGHYSKEHLKFIDRGYKTVEIERFDNGIITKEKI